MISLQKSNEMLLLETYNSNKKCIEILRSYLNKILEPSNVQTVAYSLSDVSSHAISWFKYYTLCSDLLGYPNKSYWTEFINCTLTGAATKAFENDLAYTVLEEYAEISRHCEMTASELFSLLEKSTNGKVCRSTLLDFFHFY